jgi:glycosyltransferase involved in cell wall biosynthesis
MIGYPVEIPILHDFDDDPALPTVLFVGSARPEKGLDLAIQAQNRTFEQFRLVITGKQDPDVKAELSRTSSRNIEWVDGFVSSEQLAENYRHASLVVLPYSTAFGRQGGPSSVLLETMSFGVPAVVSDALADQLPPSYEGAVTFEAGSVESLALAIDKALGSLSSLRRAAESKGRGFVESFHTYDHYALSLIDLARSASTRTRGL